MNKLYDCQEIKKIYSPAVTFDNGNLELLKMAVITTHTCTLRCKLCAERTPYYKNRYFPSLDLLKLQLEKYFECVNYTMKIDISGGEPLTRKDLPEFFEYLLNFKTQFGRCRLVTNGTLELSDALCDTLKKFGKQVDVLIDCYSNSGQLLSINAEKNAIKLNQKSIPCILREQSEQELHCNGWVDFGDLKTKRTAEVSQMNSNACAILHKIGGGCRIKNGIITPCAITQQLADFNILPLQKNEYVDLMDDSITINEKKERIYNILLLSKLSSCDYCDGIHDNAKRYPPAEQLKTV